MPALSLFFVILIVVGLLGIALWLGYLLRKNQQAKHLYLDLLNAAQAMTWRWTVESDTLLINHNWSKFLGFSIFELQPFSYRKGIRLVHPEDVVQISQAMDGIIHGESDTLQLEFRVKTQAQGFKWVQLSGQVLQRDKHGHPLQISGVVQDIHQLVLQKHRLQKDQVRDDFILELPELIRQEGELACAHKILELLQTLIKNEVGGVYLFSKAAQSLQLAANLSSEADVNLPDSLDVNCLQESGFDSQRIILTAATGVSAFAGVAKELDLNQLLAVSIMDDARCVLLIVLFNHAEQSFEKEDLYSVELLAQHFGCLLQQQRMQQALQQLVQQLEGGVQADSLTGLPNRNLVLDRMQQALERQKRNKRDLALLLIDLHDLNNINQQYGEPAGDFLLQVIGQRYSTALRKVDTLGRIGCDEFVVLIESYANSKDIMYIAKRLLEDSSKPCQFNEHELQVSANIGVFFYHEPEQELTPDAMIGKAEIALLKAKQRGEQTIVVYQPELE
ncbi:hypothetical protein THMIRHAS_11740 [Thiosulfatimonas sediminis]|uniref:GGDEF domain-containing protein n=1 Tax=Thiosulfatimonas sediminis TaxID=2675054 RepID=A0A6F8PUJ4_9GAMM|nr:sensor domain-containing diguanylate cyclase [Thiosulfatimonas sediminis]BBP45801.1 hypothetical protein THMIRHAS_11740 [Thiosulfatimonas sediminis]